LSQRSSYDYFWYNPLASLYALSLGVYFYSRFLLALIHQPPARTGYEPTLSIIVSARNEEKAIAVNVASCYAADYPAEKREVIVVDDGSTDATPRILAELKKEYPTLKTFSIPPEGKRAAMAKGIREATGELVVVLDSDTSLERDALRQIVCGFENPELGAASGYTGVANSDKNMLTRMQDVRYLVSFDLMKSSESLFGAVTCCPGCLSAYRREYLMKVLEPWLAQTFLGARATFGDDRSLTNYILRDYRVIYNPLARATTIVPETWMHYMRQQCRWKKSWLREAPIAARILARKQPLAALSFYASALCSLISPILALRYVLWDHERLVTGYVEGFLLIGFILGVFALWRRPTRHWYLAWLWIATQLVLMAPQTYWAMLTMRKNHWGTR
ncbi:MAG TPA: glycosyltransferase, partial [Elusimicrobiota bacterium]|nr:glycosyltransferase [Elusimicrobiota bacterium]